MSAYLDSMKEMKLKIDEDDAAAYTNDAFALHIFHQLEEAHVESFRNEYELMNTKWMMREINVESTILMDGAELHFTNSSNNNGWTIDHNPKE